mmetsp:Transcript_728/g.1435  ORF Transcript_728/g.1435 Transcript_728/m.1435 type:complete len:227 (-) Transcript_728:12-692(-)
MVSRPALDVISTRLPSSVGNAPVNPFPLRKKSASILSRLPSCVGIAEEKRFVSKLKSRIILPSLPSSVGSAPLSKLLLTLNVVSISTKLPSSLGMDPEIEFQPKAALLIFTSCPSSLGSVPLSRFTVALRLVKSSNRPYWVGMVPVYWLLSRVIEVVSAGKDAGRGLANVRGVAPSKRTKNCAIGDCRAADRGIVSGVEPYQRSGVVHADVAAVSEAKCKSGRSNF